MKNLLIAICFVALPLWLATTSTEAQSVQSGSADSITGSESKDGNAKYQSLVQEIKMLQEGLIVKQAELAKLRHKWTVSKGRKPTEEELKEFEEKRAKGEGKVEDNPYVNKTPLSSPARWRAAYYEKLAEITKDRERLIRLEQELDAQKR
jgi:hypothetical protein